MWQEMSDAGFFRGTNSDQDSRFANKNSKLKNQLKFDKVFYHAFLWFHFQRKARHYITNYTITMYGHPFPEVIGNCNIPHATGYAKFFLVTNQGWTITEKISCLYLRLYTWKMGFLLVLFRNFCMFLILTYIRLKDLTSKFEVFDISLKRLIRYIERFVSLEAV